MTEAEKPLIYVIEDEKDLGELICSALTSFRYEVVYCASGEQALAELNKQAPDVCIVDLNLPDMDGMELVKQMESQELGVIIVSGRDGLTDRVLGLEFGADDYITKPFEPRELVARVQSLLRRLRKKKQETVTQYRQARFANWVFRPESLSLQHAEQGEETLSRAEGDMLLALLKHPFQILSRDQLLGENCVPYDRSIDVRMSRLRKKIESDPQHPELIKTVYGAGYMFTTDVDWN
ncbi:response regulator transcription factor [Neptuniibacter sp.]|uniref:response regulator transcription factor n=1 Tax=Neptuniibacter sp. TaxID=1962643 RepID=UPI00262F738E|nr:response regulator transcription factor [Neptuniibacter sp.]MCP4597611.1 response regulator transcription factor [Neptuniibacter sp.]